MDTIYIEGLKIDALIGIHAWEQDTRQKLVIDIEIGWDISDAAQSDDISFACNYASISECVTTFVESSHFQLIETLAEQTAQLVLKEFSMPNLKLRVSKPGALSNAENVSVSIERKQL